MSLTGTNGGSLICGEGLAQRRFPPPWCVEFGAEILLDDLLLRLSADCPWRDEPRGTCHARFADLPPQRPPDLPPAMMRLRVVRGGEG
jgi:hypothetical protein